MNRGYILTPGSSELKYIEWDDYVEEYKHSSFNADNYPTNTWLYNVGQKRLYQCLWRAASLYVAPSKMWATQFNLKNMSKEAKTIFLLHDVPLEIVND